MQNYSVSCVGSASQDAFISTLLFFDRYKKIINFSSGFRQTTLINYRYHGVLADKLKLNKMLNTLRFKTGVINKIDWRKFYSRTKMWKKRLLAKIEIAIDCI